MTSESASPRAYYVDRWRTILQGWIGWPEDRFTSWVALWEHDLCDENSWFYNEDELYYVVPLLVPEKLEDRLSQQNSRGNWNDLAYLEGDLDVAIRGRPHHPTYRTEQFDWDAAKERVRDCLRQFGYDLPCPHQTTSYEEHIRRQTSHPA